MISADGINAVKGLHVDLDSVETNMVPLWLQYPSIVETFDFKHISWPVVRVRNRFLSK